MPMRMLGTSIVALALVASACGGASSPGAAATAAPTAPGAAATQAPATAAPAAAATAAATAAPTVDPDKALIDLLRSGKAGAYKVTYTVSQTGGGSSSTSTISQAYKPPFFRTDMSVTDAGQTQTFTTIVRPEGTFLCAALTGAPGCFSFGAGGAGGLGVPAAPDPIPDDLTGWNLVPSATRSIAGQQARCFSFSGAAAAGAETTGCYSKEGIPLLVSSKAAGSEVTMTATAFSTTVTDADFTLPYPVQKLPGQP